MRFLNYVAECYLQNHVWGKYFRQEITSWNLCDSTGKETKLGTPRLEISYRENFFRGKPCDNLWGPYFVRFHGFQQFFPSPRETRNIYSSDSQSTIYLRSLTLIKSEIFRQSEGQKDGQSQMFSIFLKLKKYLVRISATGQSILNGIAAIFVIPFRQMSQSRTVPFSLISHRVIPNAIFVLSWM